MSLPTETLRSVLKSQYHAALAMLRETIERCPDELWYRRASRNACWQIAYHTLYFTQLDLHGSEAAFRPWPGHQADVQHPDGIPVPPEPDGLPLPLIPEPYTREQVLEYWSFCDRMVDDAIDALDLESPENGFGEPISMLEHQVISLRHLQHHAGQLADRLRAVLDIGTGWVRVRHPRS